MKKRMVKCILVIMTVLINTNAVAAAKITNMIQPINYYVNHESQMRLLEQNIINHRNISIVGMSGTGKTQVARMYASKNHDKYEIIWFIDCNLDINIEFSKLAAALNKKFHLNIIEHNIDTKQQVISYLSGRNDWLIVFDNLKIGNNYKIEDIIKWDNNGHIIFISQDSDNLTNIVQMSAFKKSDIISLSEILLNQHNQEDIKFLTENFAGYPIIIVQAIQLINKVQGLNRNEYKKMIYNNSDKIKSNVEMALKELTPSSRDLLFKVSLINNQFFSYEFLKIITDFPESLDNDLFQLSRLALISNVDSDRENPAFEMHDITAEALCKIQSGNKVMLHNIMDKIANAIPRYGRQSKGYIFRSGKSVNDNLQVIINHEKKYNVSALKVMPLKLQLFINYINTFRYYEAEELFNWFRELEENKTMNLTLMSNDEKLIYARYLGMVSAYYKLRYADWHKALTYSLKAQDILQQVTGFYAIKCNMNYNIANILISLGQITQAEDIINKTEQNEAYRALGQVVRIMKSKLYLYKGYYENALSECEKEISNIKKTGDYERDTLYMTDNYLMRAEILNKIGRYEEAYNQVHALYEVYKGKTPETSEVMARIFTQIALAQYGLGDIKNAIANIDKSISILFVDIKRNQADVSLILDPDLANAYLIKADILFKKGDVKESIWFYEESYKIFDSLYNNNKLQVIQMSYLYKQGAKAACKVHDKKLYKFFYKLQIKDFGFDHPNTNEITRFCTLESCS